MYVAYSEVLHDVIDISRAYDLNEIFSCPNPNCNAKLKIRGATGNRAKHFARLPSTPHAKGCDYENGDSRYTQPELQKRSSLENILNGSLRRDSVSSTSLGSENASSCSCILHISTPKKLLKFCRMNPLKTKYLPGITVDDIIVDERNLIPGGKFEGVEGIRIIIGKTVDSRGKEGLHMVSSATSKNGKTVYLHIAVHMDPVLFQYCKKHIVDTHGKFEDYELAILGHWKIDKKYNISCLVSNQKQIMLNL